MSVVVKLLMVSANYFCIYSRSLYTEDTNWNLECLRRIVIQRLEDMGMKKVLLPVGAAPDEPHLPILISKDLETSKKILILSPDSSGGNLGIWGIRQIQQDTINARNPFCSIPI